MKYLIIYTSYIMFYICENLTFILYIRNNVFNLYIKRVFLKIYKFNIRSLASCFYHSRKTDNFECPLEKWDFLVCMKGS